MLADNSCWLLIFIGRSYETREWIFRSRKCADLNSVQVPSGEVALGIRNSISIVPPALAMAAGIDASKSERLPTCKSAIFLTVRINFD